MAGGQVHCRSHCHLRVVIITIDTYNAIIAIIAIVVAAVTIAVAVAVAIPIPVAPTKF